MCLYRLLSILLLPLIYIFLIIRLIKGKEDPKRFKERLGFTNIKRPKTSNLIWIHCVSVGESNSAIILIEELLRKNSKDHILLTSTTVTSAAQIKNNFKNNKRITHQFLPIDDIFSVRRFIKYWQPKSAIFIESEIWPNLITESVKNNIKLVLVNARISDRSAKRWNMLHKIGFNILKNFQVSFAQSIDDQKKLIDLGLKNTKFVGNLKSCAKTLLFNEKDLKTLKDQIKNRTFWLVSSTHKGEEEIIINVHKKLEKHYPDLLTIIAPRHPKRLNDILKIIPKDLNIAIRSRKEKIKKETNLYIADSLGELGLFYKLSNITLIAGSLKDNIGGHNPFEALKLNNVIISGGYVANFNKIYQELENNKVCLMAKNENELLAYVLKLLKNKPFRNDMKKNWQLLEKGNDNILEKIIKDL